VHKVPFGRRERESANTRSGDIRVAPQCGRREEADEAAHRALWLSPRDPFSAIYYGIAAYARFIGRHYDKAMQLSREAIRRRSDFVGVHRVLTPPPARMAGQIDVARVALQELRRAAQYFARLDRKPNADQAGRRPGAHYVEGFCRAGLD